ncbi:MAG TPA: hypothetical protein DEP05_01945 [Betaproteobacteria bacterium]|nr:hypothetical protein [Betaproteobacteria bacterium]
MTDTVWMIVLLLLAVVVGFSYAFQSAERRRCFAIRREGVRVNRLIKQVLQDVQQHRGMANAYLNGDAAFAARLQQKQAEIERGLQELDAHRNRGLMTPLRWDRVRGDWRVLHGAVLELTVEDSFQRHSDLIRVILYLMGDVAERSQLGDGCAAAAALIGALWTQIPLAAEELGQARGIGAGVAAQGRCSGVARIKLRFLEERIGEIMDGVSRGLAQAGLPPSQAAPVTQAWTAAQQVVRDFLAVLDTQLINVERPRVDAEHFFGAATQAVDAAFHVFGVASDALESAMDATARAP